MILMPQIFNVTANENAHYKRNELEYWFQPYRFYLNKAAFSGVYSFYMYNIL